MSKIHTKINQIKVLSSNLFPVVGIGASAGGLEAFKKLVKAIPVDSGMAYILVQHLDPTHDSILTEILQKSTKLHVQEIIDNVHVKPDNIYIIPSNKLLTATDGILQLSDRLPKGHQNLPIDIFFTSLAEVHQNHAIGVVLSGTASDGTQGLRAIKEHGGITFAEDKESAAYDGMPQSAVNAGVVDFVLAPEMIPAQLLQLRSVLKGTLISDQGNAELEQEEKYKEILSMIRRRKGVDFTWYKQPTIRRRIARRMALCMQGNLGQYILFLKKNVAEQDVLYQDLLIQVTEFFRDPKVFEGLAKMVFPTLLKDRSNADPFRIWIAGCSTGQEAYSMVMCFEEYMEGKKSKIKLQLFATDISEPAIIKSRSGIYTKNEIKGLSAARLKKFFTERDGKFVLNKSVRDKCVFAFHNYLKDPPFAKIDLISCRNSLIYLEPFLQKKALTTFHYALREKGMLVLGKSETSGQATELYTTFDRNNNFYTRKTIKGNFLHTLGDNKEEIYKRTHNGILKKEIVQNDFQKSCDEVLLSKHVPPGVIVNEAMDIVQFRGVTGTWLESSSGKPSLNVFKMVREGLAFELRNALHKCNKSKKDIIKENISFQFSGKKRLATIEVIHLPNTIDPYFLILFKDTSLPEEARQNATPNSKLRKELTRSQQLHKELVQTREDMRSVTEEQEAFNEELQSANEELLSGSEELQSLNEELETSKEEVQTSNEELIVVNQELFDKNEQLTISRMFAESIVTTIREPLIILTKELKVKSANKAFYIKFQVNEEDTLGKLLFDLGNEQWNVPVLRKKLENMLTKKVSIVDFEIVHNFSGSGDRIMLLNATNIVRDQHEESSILIALEDITEKRKIENETKLFEEKLEKQVFDRTFALHKANEELKLSNENLEQFAYIASHDLQEPLRKIRTFSILLLDRHLNDLPASVQAMLTKINASSERMAFLIKDLLNFSKVLKGTDETFEQTDLNEVVRAVIKDLDPIITKKSAVLNCKLLPVIDALPFQINQLFHNLLSNSIKFSSPGKAPLIKISSKLLSAADEAKHFNLNPSFSYCEISIADNGIGFSQEFSDHIFLMFKRLHNQAKFQGTGIGLALCKTIVANHHGEISAVSKENKGATFKILLPVTQ